MKTGSHANEIDNLCDQAKESDPEHSVKVSGLAYIALLALHRFSGVSQKFPLSAKSPNLYDQSAQSISNISISNVFPEKKPFPPNFFVELEFLFFFFLGGGGQT